MVRVVEQPITKWNINGNTVTAEQIPNSLAIVRELNQYVSNYEEKPNAETKQALVNFIKDGLVERLKDKKVAREVASILRYNGKQEDIVQFFIEIACQKDPQQLKELMFGLKIARSQELNTNEKTETISIPVQPPEDLETATTSFHKLNETSRIERPNNLHEPTEIKAEDSSDPEEIRVKGKPVATTGYSQAFNNILDYISNSNSVKKKALMKFIRDEIVQLGFKAYSEGFDTVLETFLTQIKQESDKTGTGSEQDWQKQILLQTSKGAMTKLIKKKRWGEHVLSLAKAGIISIISIVIAQAAEMNLFNRESNTKAKIKPEKEITRKLHTNDFKRDAEKATQEINISIPEGTVIQKKDIKAIEEALQEIQKISKKAKQKK